MPTVDTPDNLWILKPAGLSRGLGIKILWKLDALKRQYDHTEKFADDPVIDTRVNYIAQRYIKTPRLLDDRKSEIRVYWLIASFNPLKVLLYREGTVRLNSEAFRLAAFDNTLIHVTNVYQQKRHPEYGPSTRLKWSFAELQTYLSAERGLAGPDFIEAKLKPQVKRRLAFVVRATIDSLRQTPARGLYFGLYGADMMLDEDLCLWLTGMQKGPGLSFEDPVKNRVIPEMLREAVRIVLEVQQRRRSGSTLDELESVKGFEWVINGN